MSKEQVDRLTYDFARRYPKVVQGRKPEEIQEAARRVAYVLSSTGRQVSEGEFIDLCARDLETAGFATASAQQSGGFEFETDRAERGSFVEELKAVQREMWGEPE